jgi:hypothetical protein
MEKPMIPPIEPIDRIDPNMLKDTSQSHYIGLMSPPRFGVQLFATLLELTFFPPDTDQNKLFKLHLMKWSGALKEDMIWNIVSIPKDYEAHAKACMDKAGLKAVRAVPTVFEIPTGIPQHPWAGSVVAVSDLNKIKLHPITAQARNIQSFPCNGNTVYTLEYEANHPAYHHPLSFRQLMQIELALCNRLHGEPNEKVREEDYEEALNKIRDILK